MRETILKFSGVELNYRGSMSLFSRNVKRAVSGLDLEIRRGENLGVIGRNGAGKTSLLKLLSGIYAPDSGRAEAKGGIRTAFVGLQSGFVPSMSGIENVMLTGMLMGMTSKEVKQKLDGIIEYAELEAVAKQPVYSYSAGMRARLAFSVSVFTEPDLLLIDEAMSVGDKAFRKKSKEKILELINGEAAVVLVSHEVELIRNLCSKAIWFEAGSVIASGESGDVLDLYNAEVVQGATRASETAAQPQNVSA